MKMTGAIRKQLSAFLEGFYNIIPRRLISIFNEQELELLVSGLPVIDIDDLKANTEYHKYQANSLQIIWFWRALRSFDQTDKAKFMQFVTGSSKVKTKKWNFCSKALVIKSKEERHKLFMYYLKPSYVYLLS